MPPAHYRPTTEPADFAIMLEASFTSAAGHLLPHSGWNAPVSIRRADRGERCQACGRPPAGGVLVELRHHLVEGTLWCCRLDALKLNGGDPAVIARLERMEARRFRRVLELRAELRDPARWSTVAPGRVAFAGSLGGITLERNDYLTWGWRAVEVDPLPGDAPEAGVAPFADAVEAAGWALLGRTVYAWQAGQNDKRERRAVEIEAADEAAFHVDAEGLWRRGLH